VSLAAEAFVNKEMTADDAGKSEERDVRQEKTQATARGGMNKSTGEKINGVPCAKSRERRK